MCLPDKYHNSLESWELLLQPQDSASEAEATHIDLFIEAVHQL